MRAHIASDVRCVQFALTSRPDQLLSSAAGLPLTEVVRGANRVIDELQDLSAKLGEQGELLSAAFSAMRSAPILLLHHKVTLLPSAPFPQRTNIYTPYEVWRPSHAIQAALCYCTVWTPVRCGCTGSAIGVPVLGSILVVPTISVTKAIGWNTYV